MEQEINYQRLLELNLIMEGCLRTLAARSSRDAALMLGDCLAEFNNLSYPLLTESYNQEDILPADTLDTFTDESIEYTGEHETMMPKGVTAADDESLEENVVADTVVDTYADMMPEEPEDEGLTAIEMPETGIDESPEAETQDVPESVQSEKSADGSSIQNMSSQTDMRVDEMLTQREARQLRKAFTLNDKFRFRRELFNGDDKAFGQTLDMLQAMSGMDEATRYLYDDLGWDAANDHVADFLQIVKNHFAGV